MRVKTSTGRILIIRSFSRNVTSLFVLRTLKRIAPKTEVLVAEAENEFLFPIGQIELSDNVLRELNPDF